MVVRPIDAGVLQDNLTDIYGNDNRLVYLKDMLSLIDEQPTLTPPNELMSRVRELDELYTKIRVVTGFTAEQLLEMFATGYTMEKPNYSKSFEEISSLGEIISPYELLTCKGCIHEHIEHENCNYCIRAPYLGDYYYDWPPEGEEET